MSLKWTILQGYFCNSCNMNFIDMHCRTCRNFEHNGPYTVQRYISERSYCLVTSTSFSNRPHPRCFSLNLPHQLKSSIICPPPLLFRFSLFLFLPLILFFQTVPSIFFNNLRDLYHEEMFRERVRC